MTAKTYPIYIGTVRAYCRASTDDQAVGDVSDAGMLFCERAWTVVATCARHQRSVYQFFLDAIAATLNPVHPYPAIIPEKA